MRKLTVTATVLALALASASSARAKTLYFDGAPVHDAAATVQFTVKGTLSRGVFHASEVSDVRVFKQEFTCYTTGGAPGTTGRLEGSVEDYGYPHIKPIRVKRNGSFSGSLTETISDPLSGKAVTVTLLEFAGRVTNRSATGTYQSKSNPEGGIDEGYCGDAKPVAWRAKGGALPLLPPED
jgi:hypothetical protein